MDSYVPTEDGTTLLYDGFEVGLCYSNLGDLTELEYIDTIIMPSYIE